MKTKLLKKLRAKITLDQSDSLYIVINNYNNKVFPFHRHQRAEEIHRAEILKQARKGRKNRGLSVIDKAVLLVLPIHIIISFYNYYYY